MEPFEFLLISSSFKDYQQMLYQIFHQIFAQNTDNTSKGIESLLVSEITNAHLYHFASFFSFSTNSSTDGTITPACLTGGSSTLITFSLFS